MHICLSLSNLNELRNEGIGYFTSEVLDISSPQGFHLDYKWDREYLKRLAIFSGGIQSSQEGSLTYNGENMTFNGTNLTFNN